MLTQWIFQPNSIFWPILTIFVILQIDKLGQISFITRKFFYLTQPKSLDIFAEKMTKKQPWLYCSSSFPPATPSAQSQTLEQLNADNNNLPKPGLCDCKNTFLIQSSIVTIQQNKIEFVTRLAPWQEWGSHRPQQKWLTWRKSSGWTCMASTYTQSW